MKIVLQAEIDMSSSPRMESNTHTPSSSERDLDKETTSAPISDDPMDSNSPLNSKNQLVTPNTHLSSEKKNNITVSNQTDINLMTQQLAQQLSPEKVLPMIMN